MRYINLLLTLTLTFPHVAHTARVGLRVSSYYLVQRRQLHFSA